MLGCCVSHQILAMLSCLQHLHWHVLLGCLPGGRPGMRSFHCQMRLVQASHEHEQQQVKIQRMGWQVPPPVQAIQRRALSQLARQHLPCLHQL
jgi:hypothetical protein